MNLLIQPNQICLIVKLYNNRPELLPDSNEVICRTKRIDDNDLFGILIAMAGSDFIGGVSLKKQG